MKFLFFIISQIRRNQLKEDCCTCRSSIGNNTITHILAVLFQTVAIAWMNSGFENNEAGHSKLPPCFQIQNTSTTNKAYDLGKKFFIFSDFFMFFFYFFRLFLWFCCCCWGCPLVWMIRHIVAAANDETLAQRVGTNTMSSATRYMYRLGTPMVPAPTVNCIKWRVGFIYYPLQQCPIIGQLPEFFSNFVAA